MAKETYYKKLEGILFLQQFEKVLLKRKNKKHRLLKEEEDIMLMLKSLKESWDIDEVLYYKIKPKGSQPVHLHRLAKVH